MANCAIEGAKTSAHDYMIDVSMSTGDNLPDIKLINLNASSS